MNEPVVERQRRHLPRALFSVEMRQLGLKYGPLGVPGEGGERMVITVLDRDGEVSVTNDAEAVVRYCGEVYGPIKGRRIVYRDTVGEWAELVHDGAAFVKFAPLRARNVEEAIDQVAERWA
jgi:hypothetical protein